MKALSISLVLCLASLSSCSQWKSPSKDKERLQQQYIVDNSESQTEDVFEQIRSQVLEEVKGWVKTAHPSERFVLWWLTTPKEPYPAAHLTLTMPSLRVPAHVHRKQTAQHFVAQVEQAFAEMPRTQGTRLLEALYFLASTRDDPWGLTVYSDLQQDSERLNLTPHTLDKCPEGTLLQRMATLCPSVSAPPKEVRLFTWPGLVRPDQSAVEIHEPLCRLYEQFLHQWAPGAKVEFNSLP